MAWITVLCYDTGEVDCIEYDPKLIGTVEDYLTKTLDYDSDNIHWMESPILALNTIPKEKVSEYFNL